MSFSVSLEAGNVCEMCQICAKIDIFFKERAKQNHKQ